VRTGMQAKTAIVDQNTVRFASVVHDRSNLIRTRPHLVRSRSATGDALAQVTKSPRPMPILDRAARRRAHVPVPLLAMPFAHAAEVTVFVGEASIAERTSRRRRLA